MTSLKEGYDFLIEEGMIVKQIPEIVKENLNPKFVLREYQIEAISRFEYYLNNDKKRIFPSQLLFHMATGSGKTILMASNIISLYKKGYRNFLFFVNSNNIIKKTKDNFLNKNSFKYLFNERLVINNREIEISEVDNFEEANPDKINIIFTTIQGLHSLLTSARENSLTYEDFKDKKIILISDEAHHINAWTKKSLTKEDEIEKETWEQVVDKIRSSNKENIMLEYTATLDLDNEAIKEKYNSKIIYGYTLKEFRQEGYSKDIKVLQTDSEPIHRALQAIILSQYRRKVANKHKLEIKPVVLFKSLSIIDSVEFYKIFMEKLKILRIEDLQKIKSIASGNGTLCKVFDYIQSQKIDMKDFIKELQEDFSEEKCLLLDSKNINEDKQLRVNSLEDKTNEIRAIFAVDMLNEGWDVLNLFDIVRLYDTRDAKSNKPGKTTIAEAQLIGRGARYFPFKLNEEQELFKRKYDNEQEKDIRILEELYYHSAHNPKYIQELNTALRETGIIPESEPKEILLKVKDYFKKTDFWKNQFIFLNKRVKSNRDKIKDINDLELQKIYKFFTHTGKSTESSLLEANSKNLIKENYFIKLGEFEETIMKKAINKNPFYRFNNLKIFFPALDSSRELIKSFKSITVELIGEKYEKSPEQNLDICLFVLKELQVQIERGFTDFEGTKKFYQHKIREIVKDKPLNIVVNDYDDQERGVPISEAKNPELRLDLEDKDWYIYDENYGTSEEKYLIHFIKAKLKELDENYTDIYLIRNEKLFSIYRFKDGKPIEPDFVLFLKEKESKHHMCYQIFIESKGDHLLDGDNWKQEYLLEIKDKYQIEILAENEKYRILGLPFYNENTKNVFIDKFDEELYLKNKK
ncbi:MAG: DEAD/DEAH box helicase family protein [archaeon]|nr:DEAD/DEAH box helicase family protein [archaeon]